MAMQQLFMIRHIGLDNTVFPRKGPTVWRQRLLGATVCLEPYRTYQSILNENIMIEGAELVASSRIILTY